MPSFAYDAHCRPVITHDRSLEALPLKVGAYLSGANFSLIKVPSLNGTCSSTKAAASLDPQVKDYSCIA